MKNRIEPLTEVVRLHNGVPAFSTPPTDWDFYEKINELVDAVNSLMDRLENGEVEE